MATGSLTIEVTNARGGALSGKLDIELDPHEQAIGGDAMDVSFNVNGHTELHDLEYLVPRRSWHSLRRPAERRGLQTVRVLPAHEARRP